MLIVVWICINPLIKVAGILQPINKQLVNRMQEMKRHHKQFV